MIETLDDIVKQIADWCGVYCCAIGDGEHAEDCKCRICFTIGLKGRILRAMEVEAKLKQEMPNG